MTTFPVLLRRERRKKERDEGSRDRKKKKKKKKKEGNRQGWLKETNDTPRFSELISLLYP
jgi:hypothetical protein